MVGREHYSVSSLGAASGARTPQTRECRRSAGRSPLANDPLYGEGALIAFPLDDEEMSDATGEATSPS
jgi:hypothetical protein